METILETKRICELSNQEYRSLSQLNKGSEGVMKYYLQSFREGAQTGNSNPAHAMMIKDETGKILSWSLIFQSDVSGAWVSHYYTRASVRRQGYGKRLVIEVRQMFGKTAVYPNSFSGTSFYKALSEHVNT